jgi:transposase-like protein
MYSYEDRIRAVKLYIKLGKRIAATIHQLGYPTKNALKSWHREPDSACASSVTDARVADVEADASSTTEIGNNVGA